MSPREGNNHLNIHGFGPADVALLKQVADESARNVARELFTAMGLDINNPLDAQRSFLMLRELSTGNGFREDMSWVRKRRKRGEGITGKLINTGIGILVLGAANTLWSGLTGIKSLLPSAVALAVTSTLLACTPAFATWKPEYAQLPQEVQDWYANAELTPEAQQRFAFKKCCAKSEVVKTQFHVSKATAGDEWFWLDGETWKRVPPDIIHWNEHAPGGEPTLFVYDGRETCFFPPDAGI
jgi:hypothetical protein